ncbi:MAG TPA: hypothetical protein PKM73_10175 [Verrucomicrobiota bacterium]|nr:hypothetical protein [Verrucomicrobiota bacterium]HNU50109.1 hypothetical protein [Verrucomicrobiota bacterium]
MDDVVGQWKRAVALVLGAICLAMAGCSPGEGRLIESVEQAFARSGEPEQDLVRKGVRALREGDSSRALAAFDEVTLSGRLTPAQKEALQVLILDVRSRASGTNAIAGATAGAAGE